MIKKINLLNGYLIHSWMKALKVAHKLCVSFEKKCSSLDDLILKPTSVAEWLLLGWMISEAGWYRLHWGFLWFTLKEKCLFDDAAQYMHAFVMSRLFLQYPLSERETRLTALCSGLLEWAGTRKVKPIWILLKQETVSGSGISWTVCKSAPRSRQITMPAPHCSVFYRPDALPAAQPTASKHWRQVIKC